jgi:hypothetical protein
MCDTSSVEWLTMAWVMAFMVALIENWFLESRGECRYQL